MKRMETWKKNYLIRLDMAALIMYVRMQIAETEIATKNSIYSKNFRMKLYAFVVHLPWQ